MSKLPITEVKDLYTFAAKAVDAGLALADNGGFDLGDVGDVPKVLDAAKAAGAVSWPEVLPQLADMDSAEADDVANHVRTVFKLLPAWGSTEQVIEMANGVLLQVVAAVNNFRGAFDTVKAVRGAAA